MRQKKTCAVATCTRPSRVRQMCDKHYRRWRSSGDPLVIRKTPNGAPRAWLAEQVAHRDRSTCWEWVFATDGKGYGVVHVRGSQAKACRFARELDGRPIAPGMLARHTCDNRICVNPDHILDGTYLDNSRDAVERGRVARGSRQHKARLTEADVLVIVERLRAGERHRVIAEHYGVSESAIALISRGRTWSWLTGIPKPPRKDHP